MRNHVVISMCGIHSGRWLHFYLREWHCWLVRTKLHERMRGVLITHHTHWSKW